MTEGCGSRGYMGRGGRDNDGGWDEIRWYGFRGNILVCVGLGWFSTLTSVSPTLQNPKDGGHCLVSLLVRYYYD